MYKSRKVFITFASKSISLHHDGRCCYTVTVCHKTWPAIQSFSFRSYPEALKEFNKYKKQFKLK